MIPPEATDSVPEIAPSCLYASRPGTDKAHTEAVIFQHTAPWLQQALSVSCRVTVQTLIQIKPFKQNRQVTRTVEVPQAVLQPQFGKSVPAFSAIAEQYYACICVACLCVCTGAPVMTHID